MNKIAVIGNAGGGKSILSSYLSERIGVAYYAVDKIQWLPGWRRVPEAEFVEAHDKILAKTQWVIDGFGPWKEVEKRFDHADTIVFVDHPLWLHYWWATKRQVASLFWGQTRWAGWMPDAAGHV